MSSPLDPAATGVRRVSPVRRVAVLGSGYVGLTVAAGLASFGHRVTCTDVDVDRVDHLVAGDLRIVEAGLTELIEDVRSLGRLQFLTDNIEAARSAEFVFLCLPTPGRSDGTLDTSSTEAVVTQIGRHLAPGARIVIKSTVPVGTARRVAELLQRRDVAIVSNPEFLSEGTAVDNFLHPDRVVIGSDSVRAAMDVATLYGVGGVGECIVTDSQSAELIKFASNAYLATRVTFINSVAELCEATGANVRDVARGIGSDHRIGTAFLSPGPGWGGSCFPKDSAALVALADDVGVDATVVRSVIAANEWHSVRVADKIADALDGDLSGKTIAIWGLAFKAGTDDVRHSPALKIVERLRERGALFRAFDPGVSRPITGITQCTTLEETCRGADAILVTTEWEVFARSDLDALGSLMTRRIMVDARGAIDPGVALLAGFDYTGIGVGRDASDLEFTAMCLEQETRDPVVHAPYPRHRDAADQSP